MQHLIMLPNESVTEEVRSSLLSMCWTMGGMDGLCHELHKLSAMGGVEDHALVWFK